MVLSENRIPQKNLTSSDYMICSISLKLYTIYVPYTIYIYILYNATRYTVHDKYNLNIYITYIHTYIHTYIYIYP